MPLADDDGCSGEDDSSKTRCDAPSAYIEPTRRHDFHDARVNLHGSADARRHAHRVHRERRESASGERPAHDHVSPHPEAAEKGELQGEADSSAERSSDLGALIVVFEELLVLRFVVEVFVALLTLTQTLRAHLVEPLHGADVPNLFLDADTHLGQIVLDDATQLLHSSSVIKRDH